MNHPKCHFSNTARIHDVKNTSHAALPPQHNRIDTQPLKPTKRPQVYYQQQPDPAHRLEDENRQMRTALCEAIEENELLRDRVIELEALLAEAQTRIECYDEGLVSYVNEQQRRREGRERREEEGGQPRSRSRSL